MALRGQMESTTLQTKQDIAVLAGGVQENITMTRRVEAQQRDMQVLQSQLAKQQSDMDFLHSQREAELEQRLGRIGAPKRELERKSTDNNENREPLSEVPRVGANQELQARWALQQHRRMEERNRQDEGQRQTRCECKAR